MTLRQRFADRADLIAGLIELSEFIESTPEFDEFLDGSVLELTFSVRSMAEADEVIEVHGARPLWRNGYYMAEWNPPPAPAGMLAKMFRRPSFDAAALETEMPSDAFKVELHFAPAITKESDADARSAGGEG